jgi:hypothetical protein
MQTLCFFYRFPEHCFVSGCPCGCRPSLQRCFTRFGVVRERRRSVGLANETGHRLCFCRRDVVQLYLYLSNSLPPGNTMSICIGMVIKETGCEG